MKITCLMKCKCQDRDIISRVFQSLMFWLSEYDGLLSIIVQIVINKATVYLDVPVDLYIFEKKTTTQNSCPDK